MSVSFTSTGGVSITIQNPDLDDKLGLDPHQVVQPKASGGFYRFALADVSDTTRELKWTNMRASELSDLTGFFEDEAEGALNEFTFKDERGTQWAAYFLNPTLEPVTVSDEADSTGSFESGDATIPTTTRTGGFYELSLKLHLVSGVATTESPTTEAPTEEPTTPAITEGPTEAPTTSAPVPNFIVSAGAGTPEASGDYWTAGTPEASGDYWTAGTPEASGDYWTAGTLEGFSYYLKSGGGAYIWSEDTSGTWYIGPELGNSGTAWYYKLAQSPTPAGAYGANTGASPVPYVSVG